MAYLKKRGDKWLITIRFRQQSVDKPKKWVSKSKTFDSKIEAMIWAEKTERDLKFGVSHHILTKESFEDLARVYLKQVTKVKKGAANEKIVIERLLREDWVKVRLSQLTTGHLCDYRDKRLKTIKPSTFKREWSMIRSIARYAPSQGIDINLAMFDDLKLPTVYERPIQRITLEQEEKLLETARLAASRAKYMGSFIKLALATAMRRGEMCSLEWHEVDMQSRRIHLPASKAKSGKSRTIPMTDKACEALSELAELRNARNSLKVIPATGNAVRLAFARLRRIAGLDHIRIHDFRHESISRLHEAGLTLPEIQSISGHGHIDMLQRYSHASVDNLVAKLGGVKRDRYRCSIQRPPAMQSWTSRYVRQNACGQVRSTVSAV